MIISFQIKIWMDSLLSKGESLSTFSKLREFNFTIDRLSGRRGVARLVFWVLRVLPGRVRLLPISRWPGFLLLCGCLCSCAVPTGYLPSGFVPERELKVTQYVNRGVYDFSRSRYELAEESFLMAKSLNPASPTITHNLALTYFRLGAFPEAEAAWNELLARRPEDPNLYFELANYYAGRKQYSAALLNLQKSLQKRRDLDKVTGGTSTDELNKEKLFIKTMPITLPPIVAALSEVAWRAGFRDDAICYAARASMQEGAAPNASLVPIITSARVLTNLGITDLALETIRVRIPEVMQSRSAAVAHALALIHFARGDYENFIKGEVSALEAFDLNEDVKTEITLIRKVLAEPYDVTLSAADVDATAFWPVELKELTISSNWDEQGTEAMKNVGRRFENEIISAGLEEEDAWWLDFSWLTRLGELFSF
jgi:tetratricopeptide (TPR) repeat protein